MSFHAEAFIERRYTLQEVLNECTNVVFGKVTSVDGKRMTARVKVEEDVKGKSEFKEIQINVAVGQGNFPQEMMKKLEVSLPIIIFYAKRGVGIQSIGHVNGTWFQTNAQDEPDKSRVWWNFTHIEVYMHRTYNGVTPDLQKLVRDTLRSVDPRLQQIGVTPTAPQDPKIQPKPQASKIQRLAQAPSSTLRTLVLSGNHYDVEFPILSDFNQAGGHQMVYQKTTEHDLLDLGQADILWLGQGEICESEYSLTTEQENWIKAFVKSGGVVIISGQDSDDGRPCGTGWIPEPMKGVERWGRSDFQPTAATGTLFSEPNAIKSGEVFIDDSWTDWSSKYKILATTNGGKEIVVAMLEYGQGMYLVTSFQNETSANVFVNRPMMENLIHFAVKWLNEHRR